MIDSTLPTLLRIGGGGRFRQISLSWLWDVFGKGLGVEGRLESLILRLYFANCRRCSLGLAFSSFDIARFRRDCWAARLFHHPCPPQLGSMEVVTCHGVAKGPSGPCLEVAFVPGRQPACSHKIALAPDRSTCLYSRGNASPFGGCPASATPTATRFLTSATQCISTTERFHGHRPGDARAMLADSRLRPSPNDDSFESGGGEHLRR